jgi:hypothetical protein
VYTGTMLPVNGNRSVWPDWHLGHGGVVSADSGIEGTLGIFEVTLKCAARGSRRQSGNSLRYVKNRRQD